MDTDLDADEAPSRAPIRVSAEGVIVRKIASTRGEEAVVVDLTLRSGRDETCTVRIEDTIPGPLRDTVVEFHPRYDPGNWRRDGDTVVYEAPIGPGVVRRTVYGVVIDDPGQLDLFLTPPAVDVDTEAADGGTESFEFGRADGPTEPDPAAGDAIVESLVSELSARELTRRERSALREALGLESSPADAARLDALEDAVDDLQDTTAGLSADVAALDSTVEREVRWRSELRRLLAADPDEP